MHTTCKYVNKQANKHTGEHFCTVPKECKVNAINGGESVIFGDFGYNLLGVRETLHVTGCVRVCDCSTLLGVLQGQTRSAHMNLC